MSEWRPIYTVRVFLAALALLYCAAVTVRDSPAPEHTPFLVSDVCKKRTWGICGAANRGAFPSSLAEKGDQ